MQSCDSPLLVDLLSLKVPLYSPCSLSIFPCPLLFHPLFHFCHFSISLLPTLPPPYSPSSSFSLLLTLPPPLSLSSSLSQFFSLNLPQISTSALPTLTAVLTPAPTLSAASSVPATVAMPWHQTAEAAMVRDTMSL